MPILKNYLSDPLFIAILYMNILILGVTDMTKVEAIQLFGSKNLFTILSQSDFDPEEKR